MPISRSLKTLVHVVFMATLAAVTLSVPTAVTPAVAACPVNKECLPPVDPTRPPPPASTNKASFDWRLAQLGTRANGAVIEPDMDFANETPTSPVVLNACASTATGGIKSYRWTFGNGDSPISSTGCLTTWQRRLSHTTQAVAVTLTVVPTKLSPFSSTQIVRYRDIVIASVGDSAASGMGAPDSANGAHDPKPPFSISRDCYRSGWAASAQTALRVQHSLGGGVTVHFWFLACAGATITSRDSAPWATLLRNRTIDWGGMLDPYSGTNHKVVLEPQVQRLADLERQSRLSIDSLMLTVGANDTSWATVLPGCGYEGLGNFLPPLGDILQGACLATYQKMTERSVAQVPAHFDLLDAALSPLVPRSHIYLTDYFDPLDSLIDPAANGICLGEILASRTLRAWGTQVVENPLQRAVKDAAARFTWNYLSGFRALTQGHGMCAVGKANRLINSHSDSETDQKDPNGTWHANKAGQLAMADIESARILSDIQNELPNGNGYQIAFQGSSGGLWAVGSDNRGPLELATMHGTSPSVTALPGGGYEQAFQATSGSLWVVGPDGAHDLGLGMMAGTSPSIIALPGGGWQVAFQANTGTLWTVGTGGSGDLHLGMLAGTSPSITALASGGTQIAFQANTGTLWTIGTGGSGDLHLGMLAGTSPSITALPSGGTQIAFQANTGTLWTVGTGGSRNVHLSMRPGTSPSITGLPSGGWEVAFQASSGGLSTYGPEGVNNLGLKMLPGASPSITSCPCLALSVPVPPPLPAPLAPPQISYPTAKTFTVTVTAASDGTAVAGTVHLNSIDYPTGETIPLPAYTYTHGVDPKTREPVWRRNPPPQMPRLSVPGYPDQTLAVRIYDPGPPNPNL